MTSEAGVIDRLEQDGFTEHFTVRGTTLRSADTGHTFQPRDVDIREFARYEGVSDPDDMSIVYAIESHDGARGTLVDAFGVYADPAVGDFVDAVQDRQFDVVPVDVGTPPGPPAPGL
jgi:hypothetical protein